VGAELPLDERSLGTSALGSSAKYSTKIQRTTIRPAIRHVGSKGAAHGSPNDLRRRLPPKLPSRPRRLDPPPPSRTKADRTALEAQLAALSPRSDGKAEPPATGGQTQHQALLGALSRLTRTARDAAPRLPPYDQRANALALQRFRERVDGALLGGSAAPAAGPPGEDASGAAVASPSAAPRPRFAFRGQSLRARPAAAGVVDSRGAAGVPAPTAVPAEDPPPPSGDDAAAAPNEPPLELSNLLSPAHLISPPPSTTSRPRTLILTDISAAAIDLRGSGPLSSASIRTGARALVILPAVHGAVRITVLSRAVVLFAGPASQIRIHDCVDCDFYVRGGAPVVEGVRRVRFAPAPPTTGEEEEEGGREGNRWSDVQDFEWRRATQSPNWSILPESKRLGPEVWALFREGTETETLLRAVGLA
jgi:hypothetical protein